MGPTIAVKNQDAVTSGGDYDGVLGPGWEYRTFRLLDPISIHQNSFIRVAFNNVVPE